MPSDEQSKTMLHAALKLRVSLVGAMLSSISVSEAATLEWVPLFMQLLCSGAVDRQTDSRCVCVRACVRACVRVCVSPSTVMVL